MPRYYGSPLHNGYRTSRSPRALSRYRTTIPRRLWENAPTEILLNIGNHCTIDSLLRLCCVNERYYAIFKPELYRHGAEFCETERRLNRNLASVALISNKTRLLTKFLDHGLNPNKVWVTNAQHNKVSLLHLAIYNLPTQFKSMTKVATLLLERGADVNAPDGTGRAPLHYAAIRSVHYDAIQFNAIECASIILLMENGADINAKDNNGNTPLHAAVEADDERATEVLIGYGADIRIRNNNDQLPERFTVSQAVRKVLRKHGADI